MINKKILVVDDEVCLVKEIQIRLKRAGYGVITAYDGLDGLNKAREEKKRTIRLINLGSWTIRGMPMFLNLYTGKFARFIS